MTLPLSQKKTPLKARKSDSYQIVSSFPCHTLTTVIMKVEKPSQEPIFFSSQLYLAQKVTCMFLYVNFNGNGFDVYQDEVFYPQFISVYYISGGPPAWQFNLTNLTRLTKYESIICLSKIWKDNDSNSRILKFHFSMHFICYFYHGSQIDPGMCI